MNAQPSPFRIEVPDDTLADLRARLAATRWPDEVDHAGWDYGVDLGELRDLVDHWQHGFDWRAQEAALNELSQFTVDVDGLGLHFLHERGRGPDPTPLLLTHGWPDSFYRFHQVIPMLTDPERFGGRAEDAFDVVVPSIPGYGFSDRPIERGVDDRRTAELFATLMTDVLGYQRFAAHGGDIGSGVTEKLAMSRPELLTGIHLTDIPYWHLFTVDEDDLSEVEQDYVRRGMAWAQTEGAYALLQSTKPQTAAVGLNDSPAGLAAWILEKFRAWSDGDVDVAARFGRDVLLTNLTIYWATQTIGSSFRMYFEPGDTGDDSGDWGDAPSRIDVPTSVAIFPKDIVPAPREFGERFFDIRRWTEMPRGGHFAALEEPELLVEDLRASLRSAQAAQG